MPEPRPLLEAALNGDREHPALPRTAAELAAEAAAAVAAGAGALHFHPYDDRGRETLAAAPCAAAVRRPRRLSRGADLAQHLGRDRARPRPSRRARRRLDRAARPRQRQPGEEGIAVLCEHLLARGVGIEAGLLSADDARRFLASDLPGRCTRALVEPLVEQEPDALRGAAAIESLLNRSGVSLEQVHHGDGLASWAVNRRAIALGHGIRTGLEDTPVLPDGSEAGGNADLVAAARQLVSASP